MSAREDNSFGAEPNRYARDDSTAASARAARSIDHAACEKLVYEVMSKRDVFILDDLYADFARRTEQGEVSLRTESLSGRLKALLEKGYIWKTGKERKGYLTERPHLQTEYTCSTEEQRKDLLSQLDRVGKELSDEQRKLLEEWTQADIELRLAQQKEIEVRGRVHAEVFYGVAAGKRRICLDQTTAIIGAMADGKLHHLQRKTYKRNLY